MGGLPDFQKWLEKGTWTLNEAIGLIQGENPQQGDDYRYTKTYSRACNALGDASLTVVPGKADDFYMEHILPGVQDSVGRGEAIKTEVTPRIFLLWCMKEDIHTHPDLLQFMDYSYWIHKEYWTFDEAITLVTSDTCPFSHEVESAIESRNDLVHGLARKLKEHLLDPAYINLEWVLDDDGILGNHQLFKVPFLDWLRETKTPYPEPLDEVFIIHAEKQRHIEENRRHMQAEIADYHAFLKLPACTIDEACNVLLGRKYGANPKGPYTPPEFISCRIQILQKLRMSLLAKNPSLLETKEPVYESITTPDAMIQWAQAYDIELPKPLASLLKPQDKVEGSDRMSRNAEIKEIAVELLADNLRNDKKKPRKSALAKRIHEQKVWGISADTILREFNFSECLDEARKLVKKDPT